jgi:hypothetical protein
MAGTSPAMTMEIAQAIFRLLDSLACRIISTKRVKR